MSFFDAKLQLFEIKHSNLLYFMHYQNPILLILIKNIHLGFKLKLYALILLAINT